MSAVTKPRIAKQGVAPMPWLVLLPAAGTTPPRMAPCSTFPQALQVLDAYLQEHRRVWVPVGAFLN